MDNTLVKKADLIPYDRLDVREPYWGTAFQELVQGYHIVPLFKAGATYDLTCLSLTEAAHDLACLSLGVFETALHQVYKLKWDSKHKIPTRSRQWKQSIEPFAILLRATIELCIQLHGAGSQHSLRYKNASEWFLEIALELREFCFSEAKTKKDLVKRIRNALRDLRDSSSKNPFLPELYPELHGLVNDAIHSSVVSDRFEQEYWVGLKSISPKDGRSRGFINSLASWATELDKNPVWKNLYVNENLNRIEGIDNHRTTINVTKRVFNK